MRELDGYAQGKKKILSSVVLLYLLYCLDLMENVSKEAICLIDNIKDMDANVRLDKLKNLTTVLTETLKRGEEKVALAKSTFDAVRTHDAYFLHSSETQHCFFFYRCCRWIAIAIA